MSNHFDPLSSPLSMETIKAIDNLDLPVMQKHYVRILAHCLHIIKIMSLKNNSELYDQNALKEWCDTQSKKFDDKKFSDLLYDQLKTTADKLDTLAQNIGKNIADLDINDLLLLVEQR